MGLFTGVGPNRPSPFLNPSVRIGQLRTESAKNVPVGRPRAHFLPPPPFQADPRFEPKRSNWPIVNRRCEYMARGGLNRGFVYSGRPKPPPVLNPNPNVRFEPLRTESVKNDRGDGQCVHFLHPRGFQRPPGFKPKGSNLINCEPSVRKTAARGVKSWVS